MNKPFKKITVRIRSTGRYDFWIHNTMEPKRRPSFYEPDLDTGLHTLNFRLCLPKHVWYYRVYIMVIHIQGEPRRQARVERVSMKQEDDLLPWCEAFEVWCTYARML